jgi:recombination protein RecT
MAEDNQEAVQLPAKNGIRELITNEEFSKSIAAVLPTHMNAERVAKIALVCVNRVPKLMECTKESFARCLMELSSWGLEPDGRHAHLIAYGRECTLILDYKGLVELVYRTGLVSRIHADVVCENDAFVYEMGQITQHTIDFRRERGAAYAAYAVITMKDGGTKTEVMSRQEVEAVRKQSKAASSGPWLNHWNEMAKKTVFRRACKWLPLSAEIRDIMHKDHDTPDFRNQSRVNRVDTTSKLLALPAE